MPPFNKFFLIIIISLTTGLPSSADEGQWMPEQIQNLDESLLKERGFELSAEDLWGQNGAKGLLRAVVNVHGCSGAFISPKGLVSTNHHCAYSAIQAQSSTQKDLLAQGFFAKDATNEIEASGLWIRVIHHVDDVTDVFKKELNAAKTAIERTQAEEKLRKKLTRKCESKQKGHRCHIASFYQGSLFQLVDTLELRDIRLVFAPPSGLGNFGGETDNWMWPRHSIDFTLLRAYVAKDGSPADFHDDNIPYIPDTHFKVSAAGVSEGDFVATLGYPGHTNRYLIASEVSRHVEQIFPAVIELYGELIKIQKQFSAENENLRIKIASHMRSLMNRHKNARGMLEGISRMNLVEKRQKEHQNLLKIATQNTNMKNIPAQLETLSKKNQEIYLRDFLLRTLSRSPNSIAAALRLVRWAKEGSKKDAERKEGFQDRDQSRLWQAFLRNHRDFSAKVDAALLQALLNRFAKLPSKQQIVDLPSAAKVIVSTHLLDDLAALKKSFIARDFAALSKSDDGALKLAFALLPLIEVSEKEADERHGQELTLGPKYFSLLKKIRTRPVYPDANRTLRFSHAQVRGYSPKDGLWATPQTRLKGQLAKHTATADFKLPISNCRFQTADFKLPISNCRFQTADFKLPTAILAKANTAATSRFAQEFKTLDPDSPVEKDIPACFLSSSDTTGGNSGSPVINGKGELVGFNFDRVWENIAGDFGYNISHSRNITVDVRYLLWLLDDVYSGDSLLAELNLTDYKPKERPAKITSQKEDNPPSKIREVWTVTLIMFLVGASLLISSRRSTK